MAGGYLATGLAVDEVTAARARIQANRTLFKLSADGARELTIVRNAPIGSGRAITFQQTFGAPEAGLDGRVTLGLVDGKLAYVSSSIAPHAAISDRVSVSAQRAMQLAGSRAGRGFSIEAARDNANQITPKDGLPPKPTCTCGSRSPVRSTRRAWTAIST